MTDKIEIVAKIIREWPQTHGDIFPYAMAEQIVQGLEARANLPTHGGGVGHICTKCAGEGEWNDAEPGDISYRTYRCPDCKGIGATGLAGKILHYLRKESMEHDEVDCLAIAALSQIPTTKDAFLSAVIILPEGEKVQTGDLVDTEFGFGFVTAVEGNNFNLALPSQERGVLHDGYWFRNFGQHKIIQRQGKPVVYQNELEKTK